MNSYQNFSRNSEFPSLADHSLSSSLQNQSNQNISQFDKTQKKSENSSLKNQQEKSDFKHLDHSNISELMKNRSFRQLPVKHYKSLLPEAMKKKIKSNKSQITVFFFDTQRCIVFTRNQLEKAFSGYDDSKLQSMNSTYAVKTGVTIKLLIPFLVKSYCKLFLNFEPMDINHETFELKLADSQNKSDPLIDAISHDQKIVWLYHAESHILVRKERSKERIMKWQNELSKAGNNHDEQLFEILAPIKKGEMVVTFQKNKTVSAIKDRIAESNQLGKIVIVTYNSFKICEPKKKISEIAAMDRVLEVYREKVSSFIDIEMYKKNKEFPLQEMKYQKKEAQEDITTPNTSEFQVSSSLLYGKLYLKIDKSTMIEKYNGGIFNFICNQEERQIQRSMYALTKLSRKGLHLKLQFMSKNGEQVFNYEFQEKSPLNAFLKQIVKVERELKLNYQRIEG